MAQLTRQQVESYRRDGFFCPVDVFSPAEAARHRAALEGQEAEYRDGDRARNRINLVPPAGSFTPAGLALYEEVLAAQAKTLADGAAEQVGFYETT